MEALGGIEQPLDQRARIDAVGARREVEHQAVIQRRHGDAVDVVVGDVDPPGEQGAHLGAEQQRLAAARARAEGDVAGDRARRPAAATGRRARTSTPRGMVARTSAAAYSSRCGATSTSRTRAFSSSTRPAALRGGEDRRCLRRCRRRSSCR